MSTRHHYANLDGDRVSNWQHDQPEPRFMDLLPTNNHGGGGSLGDGDQQQGVYQHPLSHQGLEVPFSNVQMQRTTPPSPSFSQQHTTPIAGGPPKVQRPIAVQADQDLYRYITSQDDYDISCRYSGDVLNLHQFGAFATMPQTMANPPSVPIRSPYSFTMQSTPGADNNDPFTGVYSVLSPFPVASPSNSTQINSHDRSYICKRGACGPIGVAVQNKNREHHDEMYHLEPGQTSAASDIEDEGPSTKRRRQN